MPFLLAEILDFQGSAHLIGVGSLSQRFDCGLSQIICLDVITFSALFNDGMTTYRSSHST